MGILKKSKMGHMELFEIKLANRAHIFYSGSILEGAILIELTQPLKLAGIEVYVIGKTRCDWTVWRGKQKSSLIEGKEMHLYQAINVFGQPGGNVEYELPHGNYTFPFSVALPQQLPSSIKGKNGKIQYSCKAVVQQASGSEQRKIRFVMLKPLDLNLVACEKGPFKLEGTKHVKCCFCSFGNISVKFSMDKQALAVHETVHCTMEIVNGSNWAIEDMYLQLEQEITYTGVVVSGHRKPGSQSCKEMKYFKLYKLIQPVPANDRYLMRYTFNVPVLPPTGMQGSQFVDVNYKIQFIISPPWSWLYTLEQPVTIGTVPVNAETLQPSISTALPSPPSYEECASCTSLYSYDAESLMLLPSVGQVHFINKEN